MCDLYIECLANYVCLIPVSYTHLDVYKRQAIGSVPIELPPRRKSADVSCALPKYAINVPIKHDIINIAARTE